MRIFLLTGGEESAFHGSERDQSRRLAEHRSACLLGSTRHRLCAELRNRAALSAEVVNEIVSARRLLGGVAAPSATTLFYQCGFALATNRVASRQPPRQSRPRQRSRAIRCRASRVPWPVRAYCSRQEQRLVVVPGRLRANGGGERGLQKTTRIFSQDHRCGYQLATHHPEASDKSREHASMAAFEFRGMAARCLRVQETPSCAAALP
jgi:hypothetical protein